jgi:hypothetical protein
MSFLLFEKITGPLASHTPTNFKNKKNIKYGLRADVDLKIESEAGESLGERKGAIFTNVLTNIGMPTAEVVDGLDSFSGVNARLLDETGHYDRSLVYNALKSSGTYRLEEAAAMSDALSSGGRENSVGLVYNMLRLWLLAGDDFKDVRFKMADIGYNDGHVEMTYASQLHKTAEPTWSMEFDQVKMSSGPAHMVAAAGNAAMPVLRGLTQREIALVAVAGGAWKSSIPVRIAHSSPALTGMVYVSDTIDTISSLAGITRAEIYMLIKKYVNGNRLFADFDRAYVMFCEIIFVPAPRTAEAHAWVEPSPIVNLPSWHTCRCMLPEAVGGSPFEAMPELKYTFSNWVRVPLRAITHAMAVTEALYTGFYEIMTAGAGDIFSNLAMLNVNYGDAHTPYRQLVEACSYRFGKGVEMAWHDDYGCHHFTQLLQPEPTQRQVTFDWVGGLVDNAYQYITVASDTGAFKRLVSPRAEAAVYPVLSMGINDDRFFLNKTNYTAKMHVNARAQQLATTDPREANKMMAMMRVAGYDVTARAVLYGKTVRNWAANSNGQVMPMFMPEQDIEDVYAVKLTDIQQRAQHWLSLPNFTGNVKFTCGIKPRSYVILENGKFLHNASTGFTYVRSAYGDGKLPNVHTALAPVKTMPSALPYRYADFHLTEAPDPPGAAIPSLSLPVTEAAQLTDTEETLRAEDAVALGAADTAV